MIPTPPPKVCHHCLTKMSHAMINTLIDAFEMKIRSERALAEHRLQTELTNLRQSLISVLPQNRSTSNYEINALQEEQQMLRDMVSELQDSLEGMNRRFISSRLSVGSLEEKINSEESSSEDDDDDEGDAVVAISRGAVLKNEIVYPAIHVEKQNHDEPIVVVTPKKVPILTVIAVEEEVIEVKKPAPTPTPTPECEEEEESEEEVEEVEEVEEEGPDVSVQEEEADEEEAEELELEEFTYKGKSYYKDDENNVYNDDGDVIGRKVGPSVVFTKK